MGPKSRPPLGRFETKCSPEPTSGCWLWTASILPNGYGYFGISPGRMEYAHRAAWTLYRGSIPKGQSVLHRCDVRCCVNPDHLFLGTQADNMHDMAAKGRQARGESSALSKLSAASVREIREDRRQMSAIAADYGVSVANISLIQNRKAWTHLT